MNRMQIYSKTALLMIVLAICFGCKSKQDKGGANGVPQGKTAAPAGSPQEKAAAPAILPKDMADARAAALHVLTQFEAGEFDKIYREASPGFQKLGSEAQFVSKFQMTRQKTGVLKGPKEVNFVARPGNNLVFIYRVENERFKTDMRLTFARAQNGKMELAGLNQHDEPKK